MSQITSRSLWKTHRQLVLVGVPCVSFDLRVRIDGLRNGVGLLIEITCGWCDQLSPVRWQVADRISDEAAALRVRREDTRDNIPNNDDKYQLEPGT